MDKKIKILHIQVIPKLSGAQKISLSIFSSLPDTKYDKYVLFSKDNDIGSNQKCIDAFEAVGCKVILSSKLRREICFKDFGALREIYKLCKAEKFDIVHTHSTKPGIVGRIAARLAGVPRVIHTVHGLAFHKFIRFPKWQFYWACEMFASLFSHRIIMVNTFYAKYFKWFRKKTTTICNGLDIDTARTTTCNRGDSIKILFVGRLDRQKNPLTILEVAKRVCAKHPNTTFTLVGDGEMFDNCIEFISNNGLGEKVKLLGWQNNVSQYYSTHDIFFAPSIYESFGLMFLEAMQHNLPCVASNVEGIPEVVLDTETGLLSNPTDVEMFTENISRLINDKSLREKMGKKGCDRAITQFSTTRMTNQYIKEYERE